MTILNSQRSNQRFVFALVGALLSLGAPLGWLLIQWIAGLSPTRAIEESPLLMAYLLIPTTVVFSTVGFQMGKQWEQLQQVMRRLEKLATRDELTGLFNARRFWEDIEQRWRHTLRDDHSLYVLIIDLDHFKKVNDTYGHLVGDRVLARVAQVMCSQLRSDEFLYRVGGEEFAALLSDLSEEQALQVGQRLRRAVEELEIAVYPDDDSDDSTIEITISIGIAGGADLADLEPKRLYGAADEALYRAKESGRNTVRLATLTPDVVAA